jgi:hypothetical protein
VAGPDTYNTTSDTPVEIEPMANDVDPDGDPVQFVNWLNQPALGTLNTLSGGRLRYTPSGSVGLDAFRYNITDGKLMATGVVNISVGKNQEGHLSYCGTDLLLDFFCRRLCPASLAVQEQICNMLSCIEGCQWLP